MIPVRIRGFTLIEVLVAMSLVAAIGMLGYRGVDSVRQATTRLAENIERHQEIALVTERIGRDARQAIAVGGRSPDGRDTPPWFGRRLSGGAELTLTRIGNEEGDLQRISYRWHGPAEGRLELLTWSAFDAMAPNRSHLLLNRIAALEFDYLDPKGRWLPTWPMGARDALPRALRLRIRLNEGSLVERVFDVPTAE